MAVLTNAELTDMLRFYEQQNGQAIDFTKAQGKAAAQALEDEFEGATFQTAAGAAMDTATSPLVLTNPQKKLMVRAWKSVTSES